MTAPERVDPAYVRRGRRVPTTPAVSVCVLMVGRSALARECLASLRADDPDGRLEVVVVANGTPDGEVEALGDVDDVVVVRSRANLGFAGGSNLAAAVAGGEHLVFVNDDSVVAPGSLAALVAAADGPGVGAVGSRILFPDGSLQEAGSLLWSDGSTAHVGTPVAVGPEVEHRPREVDFASANGLLVRREAWEAVGGFDERYFPAYCEDVDLCLALRGAGYRVVYEPGSVVRHRESQSTTDAYRTFLLARHRELLRAGWAAELARYPTRPLVEDGPLLDRAVARALTRWERGGAADGSEATDGGDTPGAHVSGAQVPGTGDHRGAGLLDLSDGAQREREQRSERVQSALTEAYVAELERRAAPNQRRIAELEEYVATRWSVRLKKAVSQLLGRPPT